MTVLPPQGKENEDKAQKCYIDNRHYAGETMTVEDNILRQKKLTLLHHLMAKLPVDTCCSGCLEIVSIQH